MAEPLETAPSPDVVALRCVVGRMSIGVPRAAIEGVVELALSLPPPHATRYVSGLAIHQGELVVVLGLAPFTPALRTVSAVLMSGRRAGTRWAIEVHGIGSFARVRPKAEERGGPATARREPWLERGIADDGKEVRLLDFDRLIAEAMGDLSPAVLT